MPKELYDYPADKTVTTGIPLSQDFDTVTTEKQQRYRKQIKIPDDAQLLFVIGGGLGAQRINRAVGQAVPHLLHEFPDLRVVHSAGRLNETDMTDYYNQNLTPGEQGRVQVFGYLTDVYRYSGAADIIISRAGATNLAEFAVQGKPLVIIPSPFLVGGHQLKNAEHLAESQAALVLSEKELAADPNRLAKQVSELLHDSRRRHELAKNLSAFAQPNATSEITNLILLQAKG